MSAEWEATNRLVVTFVEDMEGEGALSLKMEATTCTSESSFRLKQPGRYTVSVHDQQDDEVIGAQTITILSCEELGVIDVEVDEDAHESDSSEPSDTGASEENQTLLPPPLPK